MARSVDDLSLILTVIAGPDWRDASVVPMPLGDPTLVKTSGLRVAMHTGNGAYPLHPEVAKVVADTAKALESSGVQIESNRPTALDDVIKIDADLYSSDGSASLQRILDQSGTKEPSPLMRIALNQTAMTSGNMAAAIERWDAWRGRMLQFLEGYANSAFSYTYAYNMTGWPAAVVRAGTSSTGQPLGVQIVGRPWREDVVLALARQVEQNLGGYQSPPI
jgi:amidase